ncbi:hypothetical protein [Peredibacter starrii]|uniref:Secreted protein n=1 Tax=Peredibacter starrii TaxID=28202 RepID=A0AAX4HU37_9BACT|nr:hypothetical protein [Peredibacter starrii]WPU66480.1 hypothetical protein SOO65_06945 [Peredibacter starrii]
MKLLLMVLVMLTSNVYAEGKAAPSKNPTSSGPSYMEGASDGPLGPSTKEEKQEERKEGQSMGGAPNVGAGMGTGTGAGSTVGRPVKIEEDND